MNEVSSKLNTHFKVIKLNYKIISIYLCIILMFSCVYIYTSVKASEKVGVKVPIIMYHSILKSKSGDYIVSPETFEEDLQYIKEKGYTTIVISDLIEYVYNNTPLPEKPIIITFDDGYYNNYGYAIPLLKKHDMKAVISIVGEYTDTFSKTDEANLNYGYLRWIDIAKLVDEDTVEFQNHTYNLHKILNGRKRLYEKI